MNRKIIVNSLRDWLKSDYILKETEVGYVIGIDDSYPNIVFGDGVHKFRELTLERMPREWFKDSISYNSQASYNKYCIQMETNNREYYHEVESTIRFLIDKNNYIHTKNMPIFTKSYEELIKDNRVLNIGEVIFVREVYLSESDMFMKVGDGFSTFDTLPYLNADYIRGDNDFTEEGFNKTVIRFYESDLPERIHTNMIALCKFLSKSDEIEKLLNDALKEYIKTIKAKE